MNQTIEMLKQASENSQAEYMDYVSAFTSSGIVELVRGGLSFEKAASLIQEECETDPTLLALKSNILAFEKSAEYIEELEGKVMELEKFSEEANGTIAKLDTASPMHKLASLGFTSEEIEMMSALPENLLTKVASTNAAPWGMGGGIGLPLEKTDALTEFLIGRSF